MQLLTSDNVFSGKSDFSWFWSRTGGKPRSRGLLPRNRINIYRSGSRVCYKKSARGSILLSAKSERPETPISGDSRYACRIYQPTSLLQANNQSVRCFFEQTMAKLRVC
jgi:hypothetical protein